MKPCRLGEFSNPPLFHDGRGNPSANSLGFFLQYVSRVPPLLSTLTTVIFPLDFCLLQALSGSTSFFLYSSHNGQWSFSNSHFSNQNIPVIFTSLRIKFQVPVLEAKARHDLPFWSLGPHLHYSAPGLLHFIHIVPCDVPRTQEIPSHLKAELPLPGKFFSQISACFLGSLTFLHFSHRSEFKCRLIREAIIADPTVSFQ